MPEIVTLTMNPAVDKSAEAEQVVPEHKIRCGRPRFDPGGGGINVARAIRKLKGHAMAVYLGGGPSGDVLAKLLGDEGVLSKKLAIQNWTRENLIVYEQSSGNQFRFGMPGPELSESEWRETLNVMKKLASEAEFVVASGSLPPGVPEDFYARLAVVCREAGARYIVDTSGPALAEAVEQGVYMIKPNLRELEHLIGREYREERDYQEYAAELLDLGKAEVVLVSMGAGGVFLAGPDDSRKIAAPTVPIRSKVGAGDSMVAGFVARHAAGASVTESAMYAVAAGTAAVMTPGTELCRKEDTDRLFDSMSGSEES